MTNGELAQENGAKWSDAPSALGETVHAEKVYLIVFLPTGASKGIQPVKLTPKPLLGKSKRLIHVYLNNSH